ncbi:ATP-binding protein [Bradyrhizobium arachidis]|uniref:ATP-binding protein n=1 Tax=Bradyrhizobium arachidis TaxID=858423 RepID=UPI0021623E09|nr:ATP-binding protein [Bradyrhizobium arachidis]UVO31717.1 ATP-binding protein [Bradyrhizobium arachidis]
MTRRANRLYIVIIETSVDQPARRHPPRVFSFRDRESDGGTARVTLGRRARRVLLETTIDVGQNTGTMPSPRCKVVAAGSDPPLRDLGRPFNSVARFLFCGHVCPRMRRIASFSKRNAFVIDGAAPIVRSFSLVGLHGYKNIRLDFQGRAKIVIAENGAGKTIFLSALDAFLTRNFFKLSNLQFERVECELEGQSGPLVLHRSQIPTVSDDVQTILREFAHYSRAEFHELRDTLARYDGGDFRDFPILQRAYVNSPWSFPDTESRIRQLRELDHGSDELKQISSAIKAALGSTQVLLLPTYRRIELSISKRQNRRLADQAVRARRIHNLGEERREDRFSPFGINYGLADVEQRLLELTESIQRRSNMGYREISAAIIDDLLAGRFASGELNESLPEIDSLRLFFSRIEQSTKDAGQRLEAITQLYKSERIHDPSNGSLRYFLTRLSKVVNQTKELEADIENFVQISNQYLNCSSDQKQLRYDATQMKVKVINVWTDSEIRLDDLSSGEKQVISLFAHMYLNQKKKIVLIDEPELSLSMEWQKKLLPDVVGSPTCRQLLAITHSPFIFENELDPCASPLDITRTKRGE